MLSDQTHVSQHLKNVALPELIPGTNTSNNPDGMAECPKCKGAGWLVRRDVPVGNPDWAKLVMCDCGKILAERRARIDSVLGFEYELAEVNWTHIRPMAEQQEAVRIVRQFIDRPQGWLYMTGPYGDGKTTLLSLAVNQLRLRRIDAVFANVPTMLQYLRDSLAERYGEIGAGLTETLDYIKRVEILALDDLGAERMTEWASEQLYEILNWRYVKRRPTLITSNYGIEELLDKRLASRLADASLTVQVDCGDRDIRRIKR